jgi:hypothetical protein
MSIGQLTGTATISNGLATSWGTCDRCGKLRDYCDLAWQTQWSGFQLINLRLLCCTVHAGGGCIDLPNETLRAIVLPPDPIPIQNPRPGFYRVEEDQASQAMPPDGSKRILFTEDGEAITTESGQYLTVNP